MLQVLQVYNAGLQTTYSGFSKYGNVPMHQNSHWLKAAQNNSAILFQVITMTQKTAPLSSGKA